MDTPGSMTTEKNVNQTSHPRTGLGLRLKTAREALHLSEKEVAGRLHLSVKQIYVMENEDFEHGLPATFMRGYLRSYARLLNFAETEIPDMLNQLGDKFPTTSTVNLLPQTPVSLIQHQPRYLHGMTFIILLSLAGLVGVWWKLHANYPFASIVSKATALVTTHIPTATPGHIATSTPIATKPVTVIPPPVASAPAVATPATLAPTPETNKSTTPARPKTPVNVAQVKMAVPEEPGLDQEKATENILSTDEKNP